MNDRTMLYISKTRLLPVYKALQYSRPLTAQDKKDLEIFLRITEFDDMEDIKRRLKKYLDEVERQLNSKTPSRKR